MFKFNKGLAVAGAAAALSLFMWSGGPAQATSTINTNISPYCSTYGTTGSNTFFNSELCAYAWQSVAGGGGLVPTSGNYVNIAQGPTYEAPLVPTSPQESFLLTFSVPSGAGGGYQWTNWANAEAFVGGQCANNAGFVSANIGGPFPSSSTEITFTINLNGPGAASGNCTVELGPLQISGATTLATPNYLCLTSPNSQPYFNCQNTPPNELMICEEAYDSSFVAINQGSSPCALSTVYAISTSQLGFATNPGSALIVNVGAVDAEKLCLGTGWYNPSQDVTLSIENDPSFKANCNPTADVGSLDVWTNDYEEADGEGIYTFSSPSTATIGVYGNYAGISKAYLVLNGSCTSSATVTGTISGNTASFVVTVPNAPDVTESYEMCLVAAGGGTGVGPIIGANFNGFGGPAIPPTSTPPGGNNSTGYSNTSSPLITYLSVPTPTYQNAVTNQLSAYGYNGILQPINSSWSNPGITGLNAYIRVVNNTAQPIDVFADVQGDFGSLGTTAVELGLPGNTNDYVPVSTIVANAGVTPGPASRVSMILMIPYPEIYGTPTESNNGQTVSSGTGAQGACTPSTMSNNNNGTASGLGTGYNGLCFVGIAQVVGEAGGIWVNIE